MEKIGILSFNNNVPEVDGMRLAIHLAANPFEVASDILHAIGIAEGERVSVRGIASRINGEPALLVSRFTKLSLLSYGAEANLGGSPQPIPASVTCKECNFVNQVPWVSMSPKKCNNPNWPPHSIKLL